MRTTQTTRTFSTVIAADLRDGDQTASIWRQMLRIDDEIERHWYWLADIGSVRANNRMIGDFQDFEN